MQQTEGEEKTKERRIYTPATKPQIQFLSLSLPQSPVPPVLDWGSAESGNRGIGGSRLDERNMAESRQTACKEAESRLHNWLATTDPHSLHSIRNIPMVEISQMVGVSPQTLTLTIESTISLLGGQRQSPQCGKLG